MNTWQAIEKFGIPVVALVIVVVAIYKILIPEYLKKAKAVEDILREQLAEAKKERLEEREAARLAAKAERAAAEAERREALQVFSGAIDRRDKAQKQEHGETIRALNAMTRKIENLDNTIKHGGKDK